MTHYRINWYHGGIQTFETDNEGVAFSFLAKIFYLKSQPIQTIVVAIDRDDE